MSVDKQNEKDPECLEVVKFKVVPYDGMPKKLMDPIWLPKIHIDDWVGINKDGPQMNSQSSVLHINRVPGGTGKGNL